MFSRKAGHKWLPTTLTGCVVMLIVLAMVVGAQMAYVSAQEPTETPTPEHVGDDHEEAPALTEAERELIEAGHQVYLDSGCAACHGENAEGTDAGPALPGHTEAVVRRQVRSPVGAMPVFPPDKLSASDLDALVTYITSLEGEHEHHEHTDETPDSLIVQHLWMALYALSSDEPESVDDALHHIRHVIELAEEPRLSDVEEIEHLLSDGDIHEAEHAIEAMLGDEASLELSPDLVHLQLALAAVRVEDDEDAIHHLEHFIEIATGEEREEGEDVLELVEDGEWEEAEHSLEHMVDEHLDQEDHQADDHMDTEGQDVHGD
jgi:mono/diheme cytochrome c family protein